VFESTTRVREENSSDLIGLTANASRVYDNGSWIIGGDVYHDTVASERIEEDLASGQSNAVPSRFPDDSSVSQAALYANLRHALGERHGVSGGLRFSRVDIDLPETSVSVAGSVSIGDLSADLGWIFGLSDRIRLVANVAHGFRAPNVFDMGTLGERPGNRFNIPNAALDSEHVTQIDFGIRGRTRNTTSELVIYRLHYGDRIASVLTGHQTPDGRDVVQSRNLAEADIWGLEAAGTFSVGQNLILHTIVNFAHGDEQAGGGSAVPADRIPPLNGRISLRYLPNEALTIEPFFVFADSQTRPSPRDVRDVRIDPSGTPGWLTANVRAIWQPDERLTISAVFENLFDERYRHHGSGIDAVGWNLTLSLRAIW
jgi:outer membrane receptor protein involved in Fe transport